MNTIPPSASFEYRPAEPTVVDRHRFQLEHGIIGRSTEILEIVDTVRQVAPTDITVLITGESGTGKEVIARAIHKASKRAGRRFVAVNCGAIPEGILESELFGHEKGAFTGAVESRKGYFEIADGGTIFLDEIGDTPISTQVKLLRILETGEFMRVGSSEQRRTDVRVIAATNKDLEQEVRARRFRQDLYYRLRSVNIRIPPLRERRSDIRLLVEAFLEEGRRKDPSNAIRLSEDALSALENHSWPGNVRELRNLIESLFVLERDKLVDAAVIYRYLPPLEPGESNRPLPIALGKTPEQAERELIFRALWELRTGIEEIKKLLLPVVMYSPRALPPSGNREIAEKPVPEFDDSMTLEEMEKVLISRVLAKFNGNRRMAARALDISERTLYRKIREFGLS
ncbi:MAG: sigma 54-interacting transcriptional regulator [Bacteroidota bacterium]|nr:sigma 54-interacting transcriptional regulator [Bacteroidota bacterium]